MAKEGHIYGWTWIMLLSLLWLLPAPAQAQTRGLEVRPADASLLSRQPRETVIVAFRVHNDTSRAGRFQAKLVLPEGWRPITPQFPFNLAAGEETTRIISFLIPAETPAGDYPVVYEVNDLERPSVWDNHTLQVRVLPLLGLQTSVLETPDFVIAGEPYQAKFAIRSTSNTAITVSYQLHSSLGNPLNPGTGELELPPGATREVLVAVQTEDRRKPERDILTLTAEMISGEISERSSVTVRALPRVTGRETSFHTIPAQVSLSYVTGDRENGRSAGWQAEFRGAGSLDEAGKHNIAFSLRGPDTLDEADLGLRDEYWLNYWNEQLSLHVGDKFYALSPLIERGVYGFGADIDYREGDLVLHAYRMKERFTGAEGDKIQETALNAGYAISKKLRVDVNYLNKQDSANSHIIGLRGEMLWTPEIHLDVEFAQSEGSGQRGRAVRGYLHGSYDTLRFFATLIHAEPDFQGYFQDQQYGAIELDYTLTQSWNLRGYYRYRRDNLDEEPERPAPGEHEWSVGTGYRFPTNTRIDVDYRQRNRKDQGFKSKFDTDYQGIRTTISRQFDKLSFSASGEWGKTEDSSLGTQSTTENYRFSSYWQPTDSQSYSAYFFHGNDTHLRELDDDRRDNRQVTKDAFGINAGYRLGRNTSLNLNLQKNLNQDSSHDTYNLRFNHRFANDHRLSLIARHSTGNEQRTEGLLTYTIPFGLPVKRRTDVATLRGRVYDTETGEGIANLAFNLGNQVAITDGGGHFSFPSVKLGTHHLSLGRSYAASDKVPANSLPMAVEVRYGANNRVEIPMSPATTISGRVMVYAPGNQGLPTSLHAQLPGKRVGFGKASSPSPQRRQIEEWVYQLAPDYSLDPKLVLAVIDAESAFNPNARSPKHAQGLMQLIPATAERFGVTDIMDPQQNLHGGMAYLRWLLAYFQGDVSLTLAAYNAGEGTVKKYGGIPPFPETEAYVAKIIQVYGRTRHPAVPKVSNPAVRLVHASSAADEAVRRLPRLLVVLRNGEQVYRRLTDNEGGFRISGLPAGQWIVSIEESALPENFKLESSQYTVDAGPDTDTTVEFKVVPKIRKLKLLDAPKRLLSG